MSVTDKFTTIAENCQKVYDKGFADGQAQSDSDSDKYRIALWNGIQNSGTRTDYQNAFRSWKNAHNYWTPIYDINPTNVSMMFYGFTSDLGLPEVCERAGIKMDWSKVVAFSQPFSYSAIPDVGVIDTTGAKNLGSILMYAPVKKAHFILKSDGSQGFNGAFTGADNLTDLTIEGAIGQSFPIPSPLTPESMISVITHLVNYAGTENEFVNKISFPDDCWEALESHSTAPDGGSWKDYVEKLGWNT